MTSRSGKHFPKLLWRNSKSKATTNLAKLHGRESLDHQQMFDVNISGTNDLIINAFKEMTIQSSSPDTANPVLHENDKTNTVASEKQAEEISAEFFILSEDRDERSILTENTLFEDHSFKGEGGVSQYDDGDKLVVTSLLIPVNQEERRKKMICNTSSTSIDSGVSSARASKRASLEVTSPEGTQCNYSLQYSNAQRGRRWNRSESSSVGDLDISSKETNGTILEDKELNLITSKKRHRMSVDAQSFSELLHAAIKVVNRAEVDDKSSEPGLGEIQTNGGYLKNSLNEFNRRKSHYDSPHLPPPKLQRKKSAEPVMQRTSSSSLEPIRDRTLSVDTTRTRKTSACIICERKRLMSDNAASVIIKTTMGKNIQERRRFSEVLKVYRPGDLPFTEFVVPKLCDLKTPRVLAPVDMGEKLKYIVDDHMPTFVRLTNWSCLYAHLVAKRLLDPHMREFMIGGASHQQKGNKFYGEYLPSHGDHGYERLLECFKEEDEHTGHETLVKLLLEDVIS